MRTVRGILMAAMVLVGAGVALGDGGKILVMGTATVDMLPDGASLSVSVSADGAQEATAQQQAEAAAAQVEQAAIELNVAGLKVTRSPVGAEPYWMVDGRKFTKGSWGGSPSRDQPAGYQATVKVSARLEHDSKQARTHIRPVVEMLQARKLFPQVYYSWDNRDEWKPVAANAATANAMALAQAVAEAAHVKISRFEYLGFTPPDAALTTTVVTVTDKADNTATEAKKRFWADEVGPKITVPGGEYGWATCSVWAVAVY